VGNEVGSPPGEGRCQVTVSPFLQGPQAQRDFCRPGDGRCPWMPPPRLPVNRIQGARIKWDVVSTGMKAAVLLLAWRRPGTTLQVIEAIRAYAPDRIYVACDGPNPARPGEEQKVLATRDVIRREIDWPCQIKHLYSAGNQGCCHGVSRAISWFFEQEAEGIILEDDCVPHIDFFFYCESLLERFRNDERVWCISGNNFQDGHWRGDGSYYFSRYPHCWGWASWSSRWRHYDVSLANWPTFVECDLLLSIFSDPRERSYWAQIWWQTYLEAIYATTWDYQWTFLCIANNGLTALPNRNLVSNIGFGVDATHTVNELASEHLSQGLGALQHPSFPLRDEVADRYTFEYHIAGQKMRQEASFRSRLLTPILSRLRRASRSPLRALAKVRQLSPLL
jgi:hypothetical protein